MKAPLRERLLFMVVVALLAFFFALACTSCASSKNKHSEYQKTDSTHKEVENDNKAVKVDSAATHEKTSEEENSIVIDFGDQGIVKIPHQAGNDSGIYVNPTNSNDYFYWDGTTLLSSKVPKSVTIKGSSKKAEKDSAVKNMEVLENHSKIEETAVVTTVKVTDKQKKAFNLMWLLWLLLIPVGYWIYNNRDKIWRWVLRITTGI